MVVWAVALAFQGLVRGGPSLVAWAFNRGAIAPRWALPSVAPSCESSGAAQPPAPVAPGLARLASFRLGLALGFATGARDSGGNAVTAQALSSLRAERAPFAAGLGVPTPEVPALAHAANALHEFEVFLQADPECTATRLARAYTPATGAVYQFAAAAGYAWYFRSKAPELGPLFVPQLATYGERAGIPAPLWAPLAADLSALSADQAQQQIRGAIEGLGHYLQSGGAAARPQ